GFFLFQGVFIAFGCSLGLLARLPEDRNHSVNRKYDLQNNVTDLEECHTSPCRQLLCKAKAGSQLNRLNCPIFISATKDVWNASRKYCREKGGDLVVINSREKQVVINKMGLNGWIGLSDESEDKMWRWVDGTTLTAKYWDKGQPNNMNEDCVVFHSKEDNTLLTWHDYPCSSKQLAICELVSRA
uniref:C-type lectin domain-containing protein n=1 Tax=Denticeps clupeoides TaxID=299321 RepID=A0AAY4DYQ1_9TELE